jgi:hypothetical protein
VWEKSKFDTIHDLQKILAEEPNGEKTYITIMRSTEKLTLAIVPAERKTIN